MYKIITDISQAGELLKDLQEVNEISLDVETSGLDPHNDILILLQIMARDNIYIFDARKFKQLDYLIALIKDINPVVIGHNIKFDLKFLYANTGELLHNVYDTQIVETLLHSGLKSGFYPSLNDICEKYIGITMDKEIRNSFIDNPDIVLTEKEILYSALDVKHLPKIKSEQIKKVQEQNLVSIFNLEMKLIPILTQVEFEGIGFDKDAWIDLYNKNSKKVLELEEDAINYILDSIDISKYKNAYEFSEELNIRVTTKKLRKELESLPADSIKAWARKNINIRSNKQTLYHLHMLGFDVESTGVSVIRPLRKEGNYIDKLLTFRDYEKRVSTYGENMLTHVNKKTNRVHCEFNQLGTATGRFSSDSPNMQNIPSEQEYRKPFIAMPGYKFVTADYSQAELRLLGAVSGETEIIHAYKNGQDLHKKTATFLFDVDIDDVTKEQRQKGKTLNFGIVYGISKFGLLYNFGIPIEEGEMLLYKYFQGYKTLKNFIEYAGDTVWKNLYSITPMGRKRFFEEIELYTNSKERFRYENRVKREGINHIIQGGSADILKIAMSNIYYKNPFGNNLSIRLQEHDELVVEVSDDIIEEGTKFIIKEMEDAEQPFLGEIPAKVDHSVGDYWIK